MTTKWDIVVLTAGNLKQQTAFELQISAEQKQHFSKCFVVRDEPAGIKIGSGGATLNALLFLHNIYGENLFSKKVLVLHSGGYSQRMPHVAALGKLFMMMPTGKTLFQHKLESYNFLLKNLPFGVFLASADTLEYFNKTTIDLSRVNKHAILLVGHQSDVNTATGHGVYLLNTRKQLDRVLQKPSRELLETWMNGDVPITDSCYLLPSSVIRLMVKARKKYGEVLCELCAYGDFLRPLGQKPLLDYFVGDTNPELDRWQKIMHNIMKDKPVDVLDLGLNSFYHFGTNTELLSHFVADSMFCKLLLEGVQIHNIVNSVVDEPSKVSQHSFVEYSQLNGKNYEIPHNCILSGITTNNQFFQPPSNSILVNLILTPENNYITLMFSGKDDLKASSTNLNWFQHPISKIVLVTPWKLLYKCGKEDLVVKK